MTAENAHRERLRLYAAVFLTDLVNFAYPLLVATYAGSVLNASALQCGLIGTAHTAAYALASFLSGTGSDRRGAIWPLRLGLLSLAATLPFAGACGGSPGGLSVLGVVVGVGMGVFWPAAERRLAGFSPRGGLWRTLGTFNLAWAAGTAAGSGGSLAVYEVLGFQPAMNAGAVLLAVAFLAAGTSTAPDSSPRPDAAAGAPGDAARPSTARAASFVRAAWLANFVSSFIIGGVAYVLPDVVSRLGGAIWSAGILVAARDVFRVVMFVWLRRSRRWHYSARWLLGPQLLAGAVFLGCGLTTAVAAIAVSFAVFGISCGVSYYSSLYYGLNSGRDEGKKSGIHEALQAAGYAAGPLATGWIAASFPATPQAFLVFLGAILLAAAGWQVCLLRRG